MLYEFICGIVPFGEEEEDPIVIYECILKRKISFPDSLFINAVVKEFINKLLTKNPAIRVGGSIEKLMKHPWFDDFD